MVVLIEGRLGGLQWTDAVEQIKEQLKTTDRPSLRIVLQSIGAKLDARATNRAPEVAPVAPTNDARGASGHGDDPAS